ncbi:MAG: NAD(P)/FAD-dependent oxidoreductase [Bryobacteraceae bacterium]|jgi:geranylgeranyl reductase family protein|nr:NAD(P)/FAD-dependent oxidoreductase [Bryobacteraceae bacterium]
MTDVLIVGAGPAGSALALQLARQGCSVVLLDRARFPREKLCGDFLNPRCVARLEDLGVAAAVRAKSSPVNVMRVVSARGGEFRAAYPPGRGGLAIRRSELDGLLLEAARAAKGVDFLEGARAEELLLDGDTVCGVWARLRGGERFRLRARITVGADGRNSVVAHRLGLLQAHGRHRKTALGARYEMAPLERGMAEVFLGRRSYAIVNYLADGTANVSFVLDHEEVVAAGQDGDGFWHRVASRFPELWRRLREARQTAPVRTLGPLARRARRTYFAGGLLAGDAAGFYDPFTGEGVCAALECARIAAPVVGKALESGDVSAGSLGAYERRRIRLLGPRFRLQQLIQAVIARPRAAGAFVQMLAERPHAARRLLEVVGGVCG